MKYTADSWFFIQLGKGTKKAEDIWNEILNGKSRLVVPTVVIAEVKRRYLKHGLNKFYDEITQEMENSDKIFITNLNLEISTEAGTIGFSYNIPTIDSIIISTAIKTEHINVLTDDDHFIPAAKQKKINLVGF